MSGTRWVLLDDTHPSISYTGPWFERSDGFNLGNWGAPYGGSQHGINGTGSLSFPFTGTRVRVLGTSAVRNSSGVIDPTWTCIVGVSEIQPSAPWTASINNWPLCDSPTYTPGQYTLTLNTVSTENTNLWFDQVRYLPLANMSSSLTDATVIVEHNDPTIQYPSGSWQALTNSATMTLQTGAVMTVKFIGTKLTWVGWTPSGYPTGNSEASYSIDNAPATTFQIRGLPSGSPALYNQHLFETPQLPPGEHTLTVTHQGPSAPLTLDHLLVQNGDILLPAGAGGQGTSSSIDGPDAASAATGTAQNSDPNPGQTQASAGPPVGAIVGGAIGGAAFVLFCVLGLIWYLRRRKQGRITRVNLHSPGGATTFPPPFSQVTPFQYTSVGGALGNQSTYSMSGSSQTNLASAYPDPAGWTPSTPGAYQDIPSPFSSRQVHRDQKIRPNHTQPIELSPFNSSHARSDTSSSSGLRSSYQTSSAHLVHHKDSGIRLTSNPLPESEIIDVPPSYTPS